MPTLATGNSPASPCAAPAPQCRARAPRRAGSEIASANRSAEHGFTPVSRSAEHGFAPISRSAEHGFTPVSRSAEHGFTLVELMAVIAIIAIASAAVAFAFPDPRGPLRGEAATFASRVRAAQDAAVLRAQPIALVAGRDGYRFEARSGEHWVALADRPFGAERWSRGAHALIGGETARAVFDPTGVGDPLDLMLVRDDARVAVHVGVDGTVDVGH